MRRGLDDDLITAIAGHVQSVGLWPDRAAVLAGAWRNDFEAWFTLGTTLNQNPQVDEGALTPHEYLCLELARRIDHAESEHSHRLLTNYLHAAALGRHNVAKATILVMERRYPDEWGTKPATRYRYAEPATQSLEAALAELHNDVE